MSSISTDISDSILEDLPEIKEEVEQYGRRSFDGYKRGYYDLPDGRRLTFLTLTSSGYKREGEPFKGYFVSQELAEDALDGEILVYLSTNKGHLHWRRKPEALSEVFYRSDFDSTMSMYDSRILTPQLLWVATCRIAVDEFDPTKVLP